MNLRRSTVSRTKYDKCLWGVPIFRRWRRANWFVILLLAWSAPVVAQTVPPLINYQGRLSNPDGTPLPTGDYQLSFNIYDSATNSGTPTWGPQIFDQENGPGHGPRIPVVQGYFNVILGPTDTNGRSLADAFDGTNRYVEITVSNRPPILPRQRILSAAFAFRAEDAATLGGYDWSRLFGTNRIAISASSGTQNFSSGVFEVTNLTVTITTTGRPVFVGLLGTTNLPTDEGSYVAFGGSVLKGEVEFMQGTNMISRLQVNNAGSGATGATIAPSALHTIVIPEPGTHVYSVRCRVPATATGQFYMVRLVAYEL